MRNHETRDKTIDPATADPNEEISKPGITTELPQRRRTLIKKAEIPKVKIEIGNAIN